MVPGEGLEPSHLAATDFKSVVSTDSTTRARLYYYYKAVGLCVLMGSGFVQGFADDV
jgi:hypothetical protein